MNDHSSLISRIQAALRERDIPAWLFYGFRDIDPTALQILGFPPNPHVSRRWFYLIPAQGMPQKLVHRIESWQLDHLPGKKDVYLRWEELQSGLTGMLRGVPRVAMQFSDHNNIPYISRVDAGTVDWIRHLGTQVVSSGDLVQLFDAVWDRGQLDQHRSTAQLITGIVAEAFQRTASAIAEGAGSDELSVQRFILGRFAEEGLIAEHPPIVAVNQHSGDPHYSPTEDSSARIKRGDWLLIDLWAKPPEQGAVYADITWTGFFGEQIPEEHSKVFDVVRRARDAGVDFLREKIEAGSAVEGWQVDDAVRKVIREAGYGEFFVHRTGHNLGQEVHGNGVNFDNLETHDTRRVIPGIACTIEPGVYLKPFGVRSELNVAFLEDRVEVTTPPQEELLRLPC